MIVVLASLLAGLGLFFTGVKMVGSHLKQMTSRRIRLLVSKWAGNNLLAGFLGAIIILITQSTAAMTFIIISLISSGMLNVRRALPMLIWGNGGASVLVLVVMLDIKSIVFLVLGISGLAYYFEKPFRYRNLSGAVLGLGLLFFGLQWIRIHAVPLAELEWFKSVLYQTKNSYLLALAAGTLLSFVVQSSAAVTVVAIAMTQAGLFSINQTMMIIYGTNLGGSATMWLLSAGIKGTSKQMAMAQILFNLIGCLVFIPLFYLEVYADVPLVKHLVTMTGHGIEKQMAYVYALFNLFTAFLMSFFLNPLYRILVRFWPPTEEEDKSKVQFIHDQALQDPETALDLVEKEQSRLLKLIPEYLEGVRTARTSKQSFSCHATHNAFGVVAAEVQAFMSDLVDKNLSHLTSERLVNLLNRHSLLVSIEENTYRLAETLATSGHSEALKNLFHSFVEGLDTILLTALDAMEAKNASELKMLISITEDRGNMMEKVRNTYLAGEKALEQQDKSVLLYVTNLFERIVWMTGKLGSLLQSGALLLID